MRPFFLYLFAVGAAFAAEPKAAERISALNETVPQVIVGGEWVTRLTFLNTRASAVTFPLSFLDQNGRPMVVPLSGLAPASTFSVTVPPAGQVVLETPYDPDATARTGTAFIDVPCAIEPSDACGRVAGLVMLRNRNASRPDFEAVFSLKAGSKRGLIAFDHLGGGGTVLMIASDNRFSPLQITAAIRDSDGRRVELDQFELPTRGTMLIDIASRWPAAAGIRGNIELTSIDFGLIVTGLRINPSNSFAPLDAFDW